MDMPLLWIKFTSIDIAPESTISVLTIVLGVHPGSTMSGLGP